MNTQNDFNTKLVLSGNAPSTPDVIDFSSLLFDINFIYELSLFVSENRYKRMNLNRKLVFARKGRPIVKSDRLKIERISQNSPWEIGLFCLGIPPAIFYTIKIIQIILDDSPYVSINTYSNKLHLKGDDIRASAECGRSPA